MNSKSGFPCHLIFSCLCVGLLLGAAEGRTPAFAKGLSLTAAENKIVQELTQKNFVAFDRNVSSEGLLIVHREPDWSQSNVPLKDDPVSFEPHGRTHYLSFRGMNTVVWKEYEVSIAKPNLGDLNYLSLLNQFRGLVLQSEDNYHQLTVSSETEDGFWFSERRLGPAIFGKIASDECLFIYLKREGAM